MATQKGKTESEGTSDEKQKIAVGDKRKAERKLDSEGMDSPLSMKIGKTTTTKSASPSGISIKVGPMKLAEIQKKKVEIISKPKKGSVAAAFNVDSDEEEEIPKEAKMRMKNLGKDTATSSGPNSFNKSKQGFTNYGKLLEKQMKLDKE